MSTLRKNLIVSAALAGVFLVACGQKDDSESKNIEAESLGELKLSSSFKLDLPDSIKKAGGITPSLALTKMDRKRSREACQAVSDIGMLLQNLATASSMACHLEAESEKIKFGTKYKVNIAGGEDGDQDLRVWVDNSAADKLIMYSCQGTNLLQKIVIDSSNSNGSSGNIDFGFGDQASSVGMKLSFDFKDQAVKVLKGQFTFSDGAGSSFAGDNDLTLRDSGVSTMKVSQRGDFAGSSFDRKGMIKTNGSAGQALMSLDMQGQQFTYRESFDGEGYALDDPSAVAEDVKIAKSELPESLAAGFSIAAPTGWDCAVEETISVDVASGATAAAHQACDEEDSEEASPSCDGADFEFGEVELE
ncbi:MAG: hypothetical protein RIQ81_2641 [Pseudomonadota bacterium]|jgi:hypothetical protein